MSKRQDNPRTAGPFAASPHSRRRRFTNRLMEILATTAACSAVAVLVVVVASVALKGAGGLNLDLITKNPAPFGQTGGGIADSIVGTLVLVALASVMAVPLGILVGVFVSQFASAPVASGVRFALDILNGVPTIIVGIFVFALLVSGRAQSGVAGGVALAIVMLPIVARASDEVLLLFPASLREAALALGLQRWRIVLRIVLPATTGGLITAAVLGVARIAGETAPLLFTTSVFSNLGITTDIAQALPNIPVTIFTLSESPSPADHQQAWAAALLLILMVLALSVAARLAYARTRRGLGEPHL